jgi:hypothetical protein
MSSACEASILVREIAEPRPVGDSVKAAIDRAARRLGFGYRRTKTIWYGEATKITAEEIDVLRRETARRRQEEIARAEALVVIDRMVALRSALASADEDFNRPLLDALDDSLRAMGAEIRPMDFRQE